MTREEKRRGRAAGPYVQVPGRLARACEKCGAKPGRKCMARKGQQFVTLNKPHDERRARLNHKPGETDEEYQARLDALDKARREGPGEPGVWGGKGVK